jgi:ATP-dependent helicase/nuclease subunit A
MTDWTIEQKKVIESKDKSLLVSAAAGSGKTAVLVERIIRLIVEKRVDVEKLLVVTFTKAAAEEMKQRISSTLIKKMSEAKGEERTFINRQINALPFASISTIHSFCSGIVKRYCHVIEIDPALKVGNETVLLILRQRAMEELFEKEYEKESEGFNKLIESFSNDRRDDKLRNMIEQIYGFLMNRPDPKDWGQKVIESYGVDLESFNSSIYYEFFSKSTQIKLDHAEHALALAVKNAQAAENFDKISATLQDELNNVKSLKRALDNGFEAFRRVLDTVEFARFSIKIDDECLKDKIKEDREEAKEIVKKLIESFGYEDAGIMIQNLNEMKPVIAYLIKMAEGFKEIYSKLKKEKSLMDFNDLEHFCMEILDDDEVSKQLREEYSYVFMDEYQDSNQIQDAIASKVQRDDNLFLVGDVKQSIYRFRLSDPTLFIGKSRVYDSGDTNLNELVYLNTNFRSRKPILDFINFVFEKTMCSYVGEIDYTDKEKLNPGLPLVEIVEDKTEILIISDDDREIKKDEEDKEKEEEELSLAESEAKVIASRIKKLLGTEIFDAKLGGCRKVGYRDIVVLLRAVKSTGQIYQEVLMESGIPVFAESGTGYFDTLEISILLDLLRVIDNKRQDIPLLAVMRSPIFGFSIDDIISIRKSGEGKSMAESLNLVERNSENELSIKVCDMLKKLEEWKNKSRVMPLDRFLWKVLVDTGYYGYAGALPGGVQRQANIRMLVDRAKEFTDSSMKGLFNFVKFVEELKNTKTDLSGAKVLGALDDVVRIMSIHKSKGLEFPIVFVGGMSKKFNFQDIQRPLILHKDLGLCTDYVNLKERRYCETIYKSIAKEKTLLEVLSEEIRVLYVAMTRARNKLVMVGSERNLERKVGRWIKPLSDYSISQAKSYLDWIMGSIIGSREECSTNLDGFENDLAKVKKISLRSIEKAESDRERYLKKISGHFASLEENAGDIPAQVKERLEWEYPWDREFKIPAKMSVTEMKRFKVTKNLIKTSEGLKEPLFLQGKKTKRASEIGSANHFVLQQLNLNKINGSVDIEAEIESQIRALFDDGRIDRSFEGKINMSIGLFFVSPLGQRMLKSSKIYREHTFNVKMLESELYEEGSRDESVLVQGMIDCFFEEGDSWVLIDYKSDYFSSEKQKMSILEKYEDQIETYVKALEKTTDKKVKEAYLYLLHSNEALSVAT